MKMQEFHISSPGHMGTRRQRIAGTENATLTTPIILVFLVTCSLPHAKLPESRRSARYLRLPPRTRTVWMRFGPNLVMAGWRPSSNFLFLRYAGRCAPVAERLCRELREIPGHRAMRPELQPLQKSHGSRDAQNFG